MAENQMEPEAAEVESRSALEEWRATLCADLATVEKEQQAREDRERSIAGASAALAALETLAAQAQLLPKQAEFFRVRDEWAAVDVALPEEYKAKAAGFLAVCEDKLAREQAAAEAAGPALEALAGELETLAALEDIEPFRKQRQDWEKRRDAALAAAVAGDERVAAATARIRPLWKSLNARLSRHYQELDLARWESYTLKLDLVRELEAMSGAADSELAAVARRLREIRQQWRDLGAVPHEKHHELGPRYYALTTGLQHRVTGYYKDLRSSQSAAEKIKQSLCEAVEAVADSTEWNATAEKIKAWQAEWKQAGNAGRHMDPVLYARFRTACDRFFNARSAHWQARREQVGAALAGKTELCVAAEALGSLPREEAVARARELRSRFQAMPRGGKAEAGVNNRFNAAMDVFFGGLRAADTAARDRYQELIRALTPETPFDPAAAEARLREVRAAWAELPPLRREDRNWESRFRSAGAALEKRIESVRGRRMEAQSDLFPEAMRFVVACVAAARRGEPVPEVTIDLTAFSKLGAAVTDLVAEGGKLPDGMDRALVRNTREFKALLDEWDQQQAAGSAAAPRDLAAELTMAIAGNFAAADFGAEKPRRTPAEIRRKLLTVGVIEPEEADGLLARAEALLNSIR